MNVQTMKKDAKLAHSIAMTPKMKYSQNLLHHLWDRESDQMHRRRNLVHQTANSFLYELDMIKSLAPTLTVQNVDKPHCFLRKFTPDGKKLVAFSYDQRSLEIYQYMGVGSCGALLQELTGECITAADLTHYSLIVRHQIFNKIFRHKWTINLVLEHYYNRGHINREFSIFIENGRYILVAAMGLSADSPPFQLVEEYPDLCDEFDLFFYNFYLVDLTDGTISDTYTYMYDCITLSHNHGISVYGNSIAILSRYRQCIDLFEIIDGKFTKLFVIGPKSGSVDVFCDEAFITRPNPCEFRFHISPLLLTHIKQRILTFLYRRILNEELDDESKRKENIRKFYKYFQVYERMLMVKIQLIDSDNVLIRYEQHPNHMAWTTTGANCYLHETFFLHVFYQISTATVLQVYNKNSIELLNLLKDHSDTFRNVRSLQTRRAPSSPSNDPHCRAAFIDAIATVPGGEAQAAEQFNATLPISTQSYATSPYLDYSLFMYDGHQISAFERPRACTVQPIRFYDRQTKKVRFRLWLETWTPSNYFTYFPHSHSGNSNNNNTANSSGAGAIAAVAGAVGSEDAASGFNAMPSSSDNYVASNSDNSTRNLQNASGFVSLMSGMNNSVGLSSALNDQIFSGILPNSIKIRRELVAFIFHPYEPFMISIQKLNSRYVVNFHIYNKSTIVRQNENEEDDDEKYNNSSFLNLNPNTTAPSEAHEHQQQQQQGTTEQNLRSQIPQLPHPPQQPPPQIQLQALQQDFWYQQQQINERFNSNNSI